MDKSALMVTIITVVAFASMGLYLLLNGRKLRYPDGPRQVMQIAGVEVTVIGGRRSSSRSLYLRLALEAGASIWKMKRQRALKLDVPELVIHFSDDVYHKLQGLQTFVSGRIGKKKVPMLVSTDDLELSRTSDGVILHELSHLYACFAFGAPDTFHEDPEVEKFEVQARALYLKAAEAVL